jgi:hypothetical protein
MRQGGLHTAALRQPIPAPVNDGPSLVCLDRATATALCDAGFLPVRRFLELYGHGEAFAMLPRGRG